MLGFLKSKTEAIEITVSNKTVVRVLALTILSVLFWSILRRAAHPLTLIFTAFFLALALNAPVHWLAQSLPGRSRGSRTLATSLSFVVITLLLGGFIASIVPPLVSQTSTFVKAAPELIDATRNQQSSFGNFVRRNHLENSVTNFSTQLSVRLQGLTSNLVRTAAKVTGSVFAILTVLVLTFMMLIDGPRWLDFGLRLVPPQRQAWVKKLASDMYRVVRGYVNGQVLLATIAALLIVVPLFVLKISYPVALMVVVFICGLIPLVGHTIGALIITTVALFKSPLTALIILVYYILYQQIENYVVQPRIQASNTDMSPLMVFMSVIIGVSFGGLLGGLVAIPLAGCLRILALDYINRRQLLSPAAHPKAAAK